MRILRGLSGRVLACGCLAGLYETYDGEIVGILDARGSACSNPSHGPGRIIPAAEMQAEEMQELRNGGVEEWRSEEVKE